MLANNTYTYKLYIFVIPLHSLDGQMELGVLNSPHIWPSEHHKTKTSEHLVIGGKSNVNAVQSSAQCLKIGVSRNPC